MIYFVRYDGLGRTVATTSCEDERRTAGIEARGFRQSHIVVWRAARRVLDAETMERMGWVPQERAVGGSLLKTTWMV